MKNLKKVLALVLVVATLLSFATIATAANPIDAYTDAKDVDNYWAVNVLTYLGIMSGYPDKTFKPEGTITRAEAAKIIAMLANGTTDIEELYASANVFTDVPAGHWAESVIAYCAQTGIVAGKGGLTFDPQGKVTYVEFLKMALVCLGFDSKKEGMESNASWMVNVLELAKKAGLTEGLAKDTVYTAPCTRDDAALILLNALKSNIVDYGYEYKPDNTNTQYITTAGAVIVKDVTLAQHWNVKAETDSDCFMKPYNTWVDTYTGATIAQYEYARVAEWSTPLTACDVLTAAGVAKTNRTTGIEVTVYKNGALLTTDNAQGTYTLKHSITPVPGSTTTADYACYNEDFDAITGGIRNGQGVESILYFTGYSAAGVAQYRLVVIETYLAKVAGVKTNVVGKDGHLVESNNVTLDVYKTDSCVDATATVTAGSVTSTDYAKGDYVLVRQSLKPVASCQNKWFILGKADSKTGVLTGYVTTNKNLMNETEIDGVETPDALWFCLGALDSKPGCTTTNHGNPIGGTYTFYFDQFGNVIGMTNPPAPDAGDLGVIDAIAMWDEWDLSVAANLVGMDANAIGGEKNNVEVLGFDPSNNDGDESTVFVAYENAASIQNKVATYIREENASTATTTYGLYTEADLNYGWYDQLFWISETDGDYTLVDAVAGKPLTDTNGYKLNPASPAIYDAVDGELLYKTTASTQYLYNMGTAGYKAYTGYANIPLTVASLIDVIDLDGDDFIDAVYVGGAIQLPGGDDVCFTYDLSKYYVKWVNNVEYEVWSVYIDGELTTIHTKKADNVFASSGRGLYKLSYADVNGLIVASATPLGSLPRADGAANEGYTYDTWTGLEVNGSIVYGTSTVASNPEKTFALDLGETPVYVYDDSNDDLTKGTIADLDDGWAYAVYKDNALYAIYININEYVNS